MNTNVIVSQVSLNFSFRMFSSIYKLVKELKILSFFKFISDLELLSPVHSLFSIYVGSASFFSQRIVLFCRKHPKDLLTRGSGGAALLPSLWWPVSQGNGMEQCQGRFGLDMRKRFYDSKIISSAVNLNCVWNCTNITKM